MMKIMHENISEEQAGGQSGERERMELLRNMVDLLGGTDRLLMTMYLDNGNSFRQIARISGISEARIGRRIQRITRRLTDGEYIACLRSRDKLSRSEMAIAKQYFLLGLSMQKIAEQRRLSRYQISRILKKIRRLINEVTSKNKK